MHAVRILTRTALAWGLSPWLSCLLRSPGAERAAEQGTCASNASGYCPISRRAWARANSRAHARLAQKTKVIS